MLARTLASVLNGRFIGDDVSVSAIAHLFCAQRDELAFVIWPQDIRVAKKTKAACIIVNLDIAAEYAADFPSSLIVVDNLRDTFHQMRALLNDGQLRQASKVTKTSISTAFVDITARVGLAQIGEATSVGPHAVLGDQVVIGNRCQIGAGVVIHRDTIIGDDVVIGANTVIGSHAFAPFGLSAVENLSSLGNVVIDNKVRLGALCTVDRGLIASTHVQENTLIDNMVHLGHDVLIGKNVIIAAQSGIAGCARLGDDVTLGGQVGIAPHVFIDEGARISGKSMVHGNVKKRQVWSGNPSVPHAIYLREYGRLKNSIRGIRDHGK